MSDKPSLYVVEKKEVIILVVLFVLVTVLSFTMGVRYGESVGKKSAREQLHAEKEVGQAESVEAGGTLGKETAHLTTPVEEQHKAAHGTEHGSEHVSENDAGREVVAHASPEEAASMGSHTAEKDKNTDAYLLDALKSAGVEPPGGGAPANAELPKEVKKIPSRHYVIQVGSHPARSDAERQAKALSSKKIKAEILKPFKDKQGEWHRVVIDEYFKNKRDAEKEALRLKKKKTIASYFIWRYP